MITTNSINITNYANYSISGSYDKKISNIYHYYFNISFIKTSREEDNSEWYLYEFRPRNNLFSNRKLPLIHKLKISGYQNFTQPDYINIKSGAYILLKTLIFYQTIPFNL